MDMLNARVKSLIGICTYMPCMIECLLRDAISFLELDVQLLETGFAVSTLVGNFSFAMSTLRISNL